MVLGSKGIFMESISDIPGEGSSNSFILSLSSIKEGWTDKRRTAGQLPGFIEQSICSSIIKRGEPFSCMLFLLAGRIERQILMEEKSPISQVESFFEAIQISLRNDQNSG